MDKEEVDVNDGVCIDAEDGIKISEGSGDLGKVIDDGVSPKAGMIFDTMKDAYDYYNEYARTIGFNVRKRRTNRKRGDPSKFVLQTLCCTCEGYYTKVNTPIKRRKDRRFGCLAEFQIKLNQEDKYVLSKFIAEHTHDLAPPSIKTRINNAKNLYVFGSEGNAIPNDADHPSYTKRYKELSEIALRIIAKGAKSEALFSFVKSKLLQLEAELDAFANSEEGCGISLSTCRRSITELQ